MKELIIFIIAMNAAGFLLCLKDKQAAVKHRWRVREAVFFLVGALFGAAGVFAGMLIFRHKTKHWYFMLGMPLLIILNALVIYQVLNAIGGI